MSTLKISSIENVAGTKYMDGTDFIRGTPRAYVSWGVVSSIADIRSQSNVLSVTYVSTGRYKITFDKPFRTSTYGMAGHSGVNQANSAQITQPFIEFELSRTVKSANSCDVQFLIEATGVVADPVMFSIFFIGD